MLALLFGGYVAFTASAHATPRSIWSESDKPRGGADPEVADVELGTTFRTSVPGTVQAIRYYGFPTSIGPSTGTLWDGHGHRLASVSFTQKPGAGWHRAALRTPVKLRPNTTYVVSYTSGGRYAGDEDYFARGAVRRSGPLTATAGVFRYGRGFPSETWRSSSYYADVEFVPGGPVPATSSPGGATATPVPTSTSTASATPTASPTPSATSSSTTPTPTRTPSETATPSPTQTTPQPSPTPTSTPTATSSSPTPGGTNCASSPSRCGYPDATNTGPSGTLKRVPQDVKSGKGWHWDSRGWVTIDGSGAVFSGFKVLSNIDVTASGVTIRDNAITVGRGSWGISLRHADDVTISDNEIGGTATSLCDNAIRDIYGDSDTVTITANNIGYCSSGINHFNAGGTITGNYIHDIGFRCTSSDPDCGHFNGIQLGAGTGPLMTINGNTILVPAMTTDAIMLANDDGPQRNRVITDNLLAGGGYTLYGSGSATGQASGITATGNRFSTIYYPRSGYFGPVVHWQPGNTWSDNRWLDGPNAGSLINP